MATTLSKGYKLPVKGERNWWGTLTDNWTRMNGHSHDGLDSALVLSSNISKVTSDISSASWGSATDGIYTQRITFPTGITFPKVAIRVYATTGGVVTDEVFPKIVRFSDTQFDISVNDNSLDLKVVYA